MAAAHSNVISTTTRHREYRAALLNVAEAVAMLEKANVQLELDKTPINRVNETELKAIADRLHTLVEEGRYLGIDYGDGTPGEAATTQPIVERTDHAKALVRHLNVNELRSAPNSGDANTNHPAPSSREGDDPIFAIAGLVDVLADRLHEKGSLGIGHDHALFALLERECERAVASV